MGIEKDGQDRRRVFYRSLSFFFVLFFVLVLLLVSAISTTLYAADDSAKKESTATSELNGVEPTPTPEKGVDVPKEPVVTHHSITVGGKELKYTATAGFIPILDDKTGEEQASLFYTAYSLEGTADPSTRPVTFAFNGGPGSASLWVHLGAFGPKKAMRSEDGTKLVPPPYMLSDNENSILDLTDMVFIDPVGTGFSRVVGKGETKKFWGVQEDLGSTAEFIRLYLTRNNRWVSPIYVAGESYGTTRAAGLAKTLQDLGIFPNGIILISPILSYEFDPDNTGNDSLYVLTLPTYAASAWYHKKITPRLQKNLDEALKEVREWSQNQYLYALWEGNTFPEEERKAILDRLVEYSGLSREFLDRHNLRVGIEDFANEILKDQKNSVSLYDSRVIGTGEYDFNNDPILAVISSGPFISAFHDYLRRQLKFETDRKYISLSEEANASWNWQSGEPGGMGYPNTANFLLDA
ncbi:MAG: peptidase S10, partial [Candidatus Atribacteria bacterium]|nr:peptidase S10 [Candidatus Atribacteria bacterium]